VALVFDQLALLDLGVPLENEFVQVRRRGYAMDEEEYLPGVKAVAVALGNRRGLPLAIWVVGFADAMRKPLLSKIVTETLAAAEKLRTALDDRL